MSLMRGAALLRGSRPEQLYALFFCYSTTNLYRFILTSDTPLFSRKLT